MTGLVADALSVYRLTRLIRTDTITEGLRLKVKRAVMGSDEPDPVVVKLDTLISCPWCVSWWCALVVVTCRRTAPNLWAPVADALAFSAVAGILSAHYE